MIEVTNLQRLSAILHSFVEHYSIFRLIVLILWATAFWFGLMALISAFSRLTFQIQQVFKLKKNGRMLLSQH